MLLGLGMRSALIVPMSVRERTLGVLTLVNGPSSRRFDETDLALAEELARRCATAIDNTRLYRERSYIARTLQQSLLPIELPEMPGNRGGGSLSPGRRGQRGRRRLLRHVRERGRGWAVVMGDVCGRVPTPPQLPRWLATRCVPPRCATPASRSLRLLNEALLRQRDDKRFCTVAYAYLEMLDEGVRLGLRKRRASLCRCSSARTAASSRWRRRARSSAWCPTRTSKTARHALARRPAGLLHRRRDRIAGPAQPLDEDRLAALLERVCRRRRGLRRREGGAGGARAPERAASQRHRGPRPEVAR